MKKKAITLLAALSVTCVLAASAEAKKAGKAPSDPQPPAMSATHSIFAEGDAAFMKRADLEQARKALEIFRELHAKNPRNPDAAWRHSMACYFAGLHVADNDDDRKKIYAEGREAGLEAIKLSPQCAACRFWTAINMALYGKTVGIFKMFFSLGTIQEHLKESLKSDPTYANAGAYRLLGLIEQKLPGILGGSNDRAKEYFEKAIRIAPEEPLNYLFMMKLLSEKFDDIEGAKAIAKKGLAVPPPGPERIESIGSLKELREFLEKTPKAAARSQLPREPLQQ